MSGVASYAKSYTGPDRMWRLKHIVANVEALRAEGLEAIEAEMRSANDVVALDAVKTHLTPAKIVRLSLPRSPSATARCLLTRLAAFDPLTSTLAPRAQAELEAWAASTSSIVEQEVVAQREVRDATLKSDKDARLKESVALATLLHARGRLDEALEAYSTGLRTGSLKSGSASLRLAQAALHAGKFAQCIQAASASNRDRGGSSSDRTKTGRTLTGMAQLGLGNYAGAATALLATVADSGSSRGGMGGMGFGASMRRSMRGIAGVGGGNALGGADSSLSSSSLSLGLGIDSSIGDGGSAGRGSAGDTVEACSAADSTLYLGLSVLATAGREAFKGECHLFCLCLFLFSCSFHFHFLFYGRHPRAHGTREWIPQRRWARSAGPRRAGEIQRGRLCGRARRAGRRRICRPRAHRPYPWRVCYGRSASHTL